MKLTNICTNCQTVENEGIMTIFSYGTPVLRISPCSVTPFLPYFERLWNGHSVTTMRHINKALAVVGLDSIDKALWDDMPIQEV